MASRTEQRPDELHIEDGDFDRVWHRYPPGTPRDEFGVVVPGEVAYCGHRAPVDGRERYFRELHSYGRCVVCVDLAGAF